MTDCNVVRELTESEGHGIEAFDSSQVVDACNVHRSLRNMLDHTTSSASPSLQRRTAVCIRNLLAEDYRQSSDAVSEAVDTGNNEIDAVSEAMHTGNNEIRHKSFISYLISSGRGYDFFSLTYPIVPHAFYCSSNGYNAIESLYNHH